MVRPNSVRRERRNGVVENGRYKGVRMRKWGKWVAEVRQPNSRDRIWLGSYETAAEAARAYDAAVYCLRGPSAMLNFPEDPPEIPSAEDLSPSQIQVAASRHAQRARAEAAMRVTTTSFEESSESLTDFGGELATTATRWDCFVAGDIDNNTSVTDGFIFDTPRFLYF